MLSVACTKKVALLVLNSDEKVIVWSQGSDRVSKTRLYPAGMPPIEIEPGALAALQQTDGAQKFILLDVREPWEVQVASLHGSVSMPMGDIPSRAHAEIDPDLRIIALCHHGVRSLHVAAWLRNQGFEQAQSLAGGIDAWSREIDPSVPRY